MEQIAHYIRIAEEAIAQLGMDPEKVRSKQPGSWMLSKGSVNIYAQVFVFEQEKRVYFQVSSPIMEWPESSEEALAKDLLHLNYQIFGAAFCLFEKQIVLKIVREVSGMDTAEALDMFRRVGHYADMFDDQLKEKYPFRVPVGFKAFKAQDKEEKE